MIRPLFYWLHIIMGRGDVFLDGNSTTLVDPRVLTAFTKMSRAYYANPSTSYDNGVQARCCIEQCRAYTAKAMGAPTDTIYFCSGATEANNLCIRGVVRAHVKPEVVMTCFEHASVHNTVRDLADSGACTFRECGVDPSTGLVDLASLRALLNPRVRLVCVIVGHNELGVIQDMAAIERLVRKHAPRAVLHADITQLVGKYPIQLMHFDTAAWSAHKFHGIRGCGGFYIRDPKLVRPCLTGGGQERAMRPSTESTALIYAMTLAMKLCLDTHAADMKRVTAMRDGIQEGLRHLFHERMRVNCEKFRMYNTLSVSIEGLDSKLVMRILDHKRICINVGSACNRDVVSRNLEAVLPGRPDLHRGTLRISLSRMTTPKDCTRFIRAMEEVASGKDPGPVPSRVCRVASFFV